MNEDFGVGRHRPARPHVAPRHATDGSGPRHRIQYSRRFREQLRERAVEKEPPAANAADVDSPGSTHVILPPPVAIPHSSFARDTGDDSINRASDSNSSYNDTLPDSNDPDTGQQDSNGENPKDKPDRPLKERWYRRIAGLASLIAGKLSRRQWLIVASVFVLLCAGATSYALTRPDAFKEPPAAKSKAKPKPKPLPPAPPTSPLTGMPVSAEDAKHVVTAVMIENSLNARPQTGLNHAGVVFEAIAEYGITRFLALYQEAKPGNLGPIRSVRPYYVDWAKSFDAPIAHVGGSPDALAKIRNEHVRDLDQFSNSGAYRRVGTRYAPHNVYSTMAQLNQTAAGKGWTTSNFTAFPRKKEAPAKQPTVTKVDIAISSPAYNVHYDYDPVSNSYMRVMAGAVHADADSGGQLAPKVVIGLATGFGLEPDGLHSRYQIPGTGKAFIFQDGTVTETTWKRDAPASQYTFSDAAGKPVKLNPGQTWITVVGDPGAVTYTP